MAFVLARLVAPVLEPVTFPEMSRHMRDIDEEDIEIVQAFIAVARAEVEACTRSSMLTQTLQRSFDRFPTAILLSHPPIKSISEITYVDEAGAAQTLDPAGYQSDLVSRPARLCPAPGAVWPRTQPERLNSVQVKYIAGETTPEEVNPMLRLAVRLMVGDLYEHREGELDIGEALKAIVSNKALPRILGLLWNPYPSFKRAE